MLTTRDLPYVIRALVALGTVAGLAAGCTVEYEDAEDQRAAERVEEDLDRAGERVEEDLDRAGERIEEAGEELAAGARRLGERLDREAVRLNRQIEPRLEDAALAARVKARLIADPEVNPFQIDVDALDGVVTLGGMVESDHERREAEELARRTEGVREVVSNLEVGRRG